MSLGPSAPACDAQAGHCITCGDEGIPMRVIRTATSGIALCSDAADQRHEIAVDLVEPVAAGDGILVHAGVAIGRVGVVS